jgi:hypothetical protein
MIRPICDQVRPACLPQSILRRPSTLLNAIFYNHPLQAHFSLLHPGKVNGEYQPLFKKFGYGTTIWSPLESGQLSGKYVDGVPKGSRYDTNPEFFKETVAKLNSCAPLLAPSIALILADKQMASIWRADCKGPRERRRPRRSRSSWPSPRRSARPRPSSPSPGRESPHSIGSLEAPSSN